MNKEEIKRLTRRCLKNYPSYSKEQEVKVAVEKDFVYIGYVTRYDKKFTNSPARDSTFFDLNIKGDTCYILDFFIEEKKRRNGCGRKLYGCVEEIAKEFRCRVMNTTPSGEGREFWLRMGFEYIGKMAAEKAL